MPDSRSSAPLVVGLGGTARPGSSTERVLSLALAEAEAHGARAALIGGEDLAALPLYAPDSPRRTEGQRRVIELIRRADGLILATPAYHGGVSGLVKNALDLLEDLREDDRPYLDGRPVGCIVTAYGPQAGGATLAGLRTIVHALRGWPTPLGASLNSAEGLFTETGAFKSDRDRGQIAELARQVTWFASLGGDARSGSPLPAERDWPRIPPVLLSVS